ncbi:MAG: hypothetical protein H6Q13_2177 [Bacteroidetes bacterium]|nr:hypothetical protein [Bacteroidota bacterium]
MAQIISKNENAGISERIREIRKHLFNDSNLSFSEFMGEKTATTSGWVSGKRGVGRSVLDKILAKLPKINPTWLLTGEGEMLNDNSSIAVNEKIQEKKEVFEYTNEEACTTVREPLVNYRIGVPYYNVDFIAGFDLILNDQTRVPEYLIDFKKYNEADCWCNITGHSMEPEITHGDIIALKEVVDWQEFLPFGEIYGIVTKEHRTVKRITASEKEGYFRLIPTNKAPEYKPQDIPIKIILRVFKVLGCMKRL